MWLLQTVFLDECYELIKQHDMAAMAERFAEHVDQPDEAQKYLAYCEQNGIFVRVVDEKGDDVISSTHTGELNDLYGVSYYDLVALIMEANAGDGTAYVSYTANEIAVPQMSPQNPFFDLQEARMARYEGMVYLKLALRSDGSTVAILLNTQITPLDATIDTLRIQILFMSIIVLLMAVVLGILISHTISRPIAEVNSRAKLLSQGVYEAPEIKRGYREIRELNQTLTEAAYELSKTETMRRDLIANVSHDLRTPLTMITGYAEVMRDIPGENTPENVQVIIDESQRLSELVNDLLFVSKTSAGMERLEREDYNLTEDIRILLERYNRLRGEGYSITFEAESELFVNADRARIQQVLYNLINNAIAYTNDKTVVIRQTDQGDTVRIQIIDRGDGIAQEDLSLIWDRYYKVDKQHKRAQIGTGLGLSIVKGILQMHAVKFGVQSQLGAGSTFWFELPKSDK